MTDRLISSWLERISKENRKKYFLIIFSAIITGILSYFYLMVDGYMCPDGLTEGLYYYTSKNWALRNGRWSIEYLLKLHHPTGLTGGVKNLITIFACS